MIPPQWFLLSLLILSAIIWIAHTLADSRFHKQLIDLSKKLDMHHARCDLFEIRKKLETAWPIPNCADWQVADVLYGTLAGLRRYVFTVYFTGGPLDHFKRESRVAAYIENIDQQQEEAALTLADPVGSRIEQYQRLLSPSSIAEHA
jgi:hypothetical protein